MSRRLVVIFGFFLLFSSLLFVNLDSIEVKASNDYPVHNLDSGFNYTSIQEAIDAPETLDGHTIFVESGIYSEKVVINKSLSLLGEDKENTIIDANGTLRPILIEKSRVTLKGFTITNGFEGIWVRQPISRIVREVIIDGNNISNNAYYGIVLEGASFPLNEDNHVIRNNLMKNNRIGIELLGCKNITITRNEIRNHTDYGIRFNASPYQPAELRGSHNNHVSSNTFAENGIGIVLVGTGNRFYHNNFLNNLNQVDVIDPSLTHHNNWSNGSPEEGNYWSDYNGIDANHDGIGDSPHILDANNTDNFPLRGIFYTFEVFLPSPIAGSEYVESISNSTVKFIGLLVWLSSPNQYLQPGQEFLQFNASGEDGTAGFFRIMIPRIVLNGSSYTVLVGWTPLNVTELPITNSTHAYLYCTYGHSEHEIMVIPEYSSLILLPLLLTTSLAALVYRKRSLTKVF